MRKITLILGVILLLSGCTWLGNQKSNIETCWNDPACREEAVDRSKSYGDTAGTVASLSPIPAAGPVIKSAVTYGALLVLLMNGGASLRKKKENNG